MLAATILELFGIVGVIVLIILAAGVTFVAYHIWRFKRAMGTIGKQFQAMGEVLKAGVVPSTLGLTPVDDPLLDQPELLAAARAMEAAGLRRGGVYTSTRMPGLRLVTLADPQRQVTASVHVTPSHGLNVDVVTRFADGGALTHRTLPSLGLEHPPKFESVVMVGQTPTAVLEEHLASRDATRERRTIEPADVVAAIEEYHAEETRWRDGRGGLTAGEVRATRRATGKAEPNALEMAIVLASSRAESQQRLADANRDALLASGAWTRERWDLDGGRVIFVTDQTDADELNVEIDGLLGDELFDEAARRELAARIASDGPREAMHRWVTDGWRNVELVAGFDAPEPTEAYFFPR